MKRTFRSGKRPQRSAIGAAVALAFLPVCAAWALPTGEQVVAGQVAVTRPGTGNMLVQQGGNSAIVNWTGFSVGAGESVRFQQPDASSVILNRVLGNGASDIYGQLSANGKVFLVNPNGVLFGPGARVDVGSLVASTLSISNADFAAGRYAFSGSGGSVVNQGAISAASGGTVALLGGSVRNDGTISAQLGTIALGAGRQITLDLAGDGLSQLTVSEAALNAQIASGGAVVADGGQVILSARAVDALTGSVINQSGNVRARSLVERNGRIVLDAGDNGTTLVSGSIDATGAAGRKGGDIQVLGHHVGITGNAVVDASGDAGGGGVLVGGDYQGKNAAVRNAEATFVGAGATLRADAIASGNGGKVIVWSDEATRAYGTFSARGGAASGDGGLIETSGKYLDTAGARVDASAPTGVAGQWLLDPATITVREPVSETDATEGGTLPNFTANIAFATVLNTDINNALNAGTSVVLDTGAAGLNGSGDIRVVAPITKTTGGAASLTLSAARNISINQTVASNSGALNMVFRADTDGNGVGGVSVDGANLISNGGSISIGGGFGGGAGTYLLTDPIQFRSAVRLIDALIDTRSSGTAGGAFSARGNIPAALTSGPDTSGIFVSGVTVLTASGTIALAGIASGPNTTDGVRMNPGVESPSLFQTTTGSISISGRAANAGGAGVRIGDDVELRTTSGSVGINGIATGAGGTGVYNAGGLISTSAGGSINVFGQGTNQGVHFDGNCGGDGCLPGRAITAGAPGTISLTGVSTAGGLGVELEGGAIVGDAATRGNIILQAGSSGAADSIALHDSFSSAVVTTTANIALRPTDATTAIGVGSGSGPFQLSQQDLAALNLPPTGTLIVGGDQQTGRIEVAGVPSFPSSITLQNEGTGSAGIGLPQGISAPGRTVSLATRGPLDLVGAVNAGRLLIKADSAVSLTDPLNNVGTLTVDPPASFTYIQDAALTIGPFASAGIVGGAVAPIAVTSNATSRGDFFVQSRNGSISLAQGIATLDPASSIVLVSGTTFNKTGGGTLTPGVGGFWQIWANTWVGESRGGLAPGNALPNLYGCVYPACSISSVTITPGNHFLYTQRPTVTVAGPTLTKQEGAANPPLDTFTVTGVQSSLGDTQPDAVAGSFSTTATSSSAAGNYSIDGVFSSPSGYIVAVVPGRLAVTAPGTPTPPPDEPPPPGPGPEQPPSGTPPGHGVQVEIARVERDAPETTFLYDRNLGLPQICAATGPTVLDRTSQGDDILALEWSRLRQRPNLSSCLDLGQRNGCSDF